MSEMLVCDALTHTGSQPGHSSGHSLVTVLATASSQPGHSSGHSLVTTWSQYGHNLVTALATAWSQPGHSTVTTWLQFWPQPGHNLVTVRSQPGHSLVTALATAWSQSGHSLVTRFTGTLHHQRSLAVHVSDVVVVDVGDGGRRHVAQLCAQSAEGGPLVRLLGPALRHRFVEPGMNIVKFRH